MARTHHLTRRTALALGATAAGAALLPRPAPASGLAQIGAPAPHWYASQWLNSPPLDLEPLRGKVVILEFFQMLCMACTAFSRPLIKRWSTEFATEIAAGDLVIAGMHSVFELHNHQTPARLESWMHQQGITHPVAVDAYDPAISDRLPLTMIAYGVLGTPTIAMIDRAGTLAFQHSGAFDIAPAEQLVRDLID